jgi:hypothetical protein
MPHAMCPSSQVAFYKHCGSQGQAKCGRNPAWRPRLGFKHAFEIGVARKTACVNYLQAPRRGRDFAPERPSNFPAVLLNYRITASAAFSRTVRATVFAAGGIMVAENLATGDLPRRSLRRTAAGLLAVLACAIALAAPAAALPPPNAGINSTDAMLKWISTYRGKPAPDGVPVLVHALSDLQAFKDAETCGAYIGFIAGVLGANPDRAEALIEKMLTIQPADHWVLVRAIAYSGLPNWKVLLVKFVDRMPARGGMIDKYVGGKLPTLEQISYQNAKPGMLDKIKDALKIGADHKKAVAIDPSPELIDVLWGMYLATGSYQPVGRMIKLLPLANDKDNVDNLTTGSAAKFTLASNAVRDLHLLAMLKRAVKGQPDDVAKVLNDVIDTAENVDTTRMRKESLAAIDEIKQKGPNSKRELSGWGQVGQGALSMGCIVAAATGQIELGIPCVIGGAAYSAGVQYISH